LKQGYTMMHGQKNIKLCVGKGMFISFDIWAQQTALGLRKRTSSECYSINWWRWNCTITRNIFLSNN